MVAAVTGSLGANISPQFEKCSQEWMIAHALLDKVSKENETCCPWHRVYR
jgi:hypothetical protein